MLKPKKRKQRVQLVVKGDQFVVHHPLYGRKALSNNETNALYSLGLMYGDARRAPYTARQALYIASQRHRFACVGVIGIRQLTDDALKRLAEKNEYAPPKYDASKKHYFNNLNDE